MTLSTKVMVSVSEKVQPAAVAAAEQAAAAAAAAPPPKPPPPPPPPPAGGALGRRTACGRLAAGGAAPAAASRPAAPRAEAELRAHLVDHRLRRPPRLQRLGEIEADAQRVRRELSKLTGRRSTLTSCPLTLSRDEAIGERRLDRRRDA